MKPVAVWIGKLTMILLCSLCVARGATLISTHDPTVPPPAGANGESGSAVVSPDGRYVLFASTADNLAPRTITNPVVGPVQSVQQVFLRDRTNGTTTLVSINLSGTGGGNDDSWPTGISTNGRYALFESLASDLVTGDTNNLGDVFVRDLVGHTTTLVSQALASGSGNGVSRSSVMTPDARYVAFVSAADNLVAGDANGIADVFVRDLQAGTTKLASPGAVSTNSPMHMGGSDCPVITPDGRYLAFSSTATNLVPGVNYSGEIYVRDTVGGTTAWASADARILFQYLVGGTNCISFNQVISADGQYVAFEVATNSLVPSLGTGLLLRYNLRTSLLDVLDEFAAVPVGALEDLRTIDMTPDGRFVAFVGIVTDPLTNTAVYVWDSQTTISTLASPQYSNSLPANGVCLSPVLDSTGRYVSFVSSSGNLVSNALTGVFHLYRRDLQGGTALVDISTNGSGAGVNSVLFPAMSADGRVVVFDTGAGNLVTNGHSPNHQVFARDLTASQTEFLSVHDPALGSQTATGNSLLTSTSVSSDGRFVAFASDADNLVPNDTNGLRDVIVHDVLAGTNILVSVATNGGSANASSDAVALSGNGRYVVFTSTASNLLPGDTNGQQDVFLRDLATGTTELISVTTSGGFGTGSARARAVLPNPDSPPQISWDGRFVTFFSRAKDLAPNVSTNSNLGYGDFFVRDRTLHTTSVMTPAGAYPFPYSMTPDGRFIAFEGAYSLNYDGTQTLYVWDSFAANRIYTNWITTNNPDPITAQTFTMAISPDGHWLAYISPQKTLALNDIWARTNWASGYGLNWGLDSILQPSGLSFSGDSRYLVFATTNALVTSDNNQTNDVYLRDLVAGTNFLISRAFDSTNSPAGASDSGAISSDGRFVAFRSFATNCVANDLNGVPDVILYDRNTGANTLLNQSILGNWSANDRSTMPVFSGDGRTLFFQSRASDLALNDFNQAIDLFLVSLYASNSSPPFSVLIQRLAPGGQRTLTWPAVDGVTYTVQFKDQLVNTWQPLTGQINLASNSAWFVDPAPPATHRFYRVQANQ